MSETEQPSAKPKLGTVYKPAYTFVIFGIVTLLVVVGMIVGLVFALKKT